MKRKAGMYCLLDWKSKQIIASGEQSKFIKQKIAKNKQTEKVINWLKEVNYRLEKEDPLGGKILVSNARKTKNNSVSV